MNEQDLLAQWKREEEQPFSGWDFSHLEGRYVESSPPWSYDQRVRTLLRQAHTVLDMGTGGGEKLLEFKDLLPESTFATEGWPPNIPVARANLGPHGIQVLPYDIETEARMPFAADTFDLVLNRHEAFDALEVARILKPGGVFLTQQVDGLSMASIAAVFGREPSSPHVTLAMCGEEVKQAGLSIEYAEEAMGKMTFSDVGAFVYYCHAIPWEAPEDFSVERYAPQLLGLHRSGRLSFDLGHFIIQARKPVQAIVQPKAAGEAKEKTPREKLLEEVLAFVRAASRLAGVTRIALIGSLTTTKQDPKDADLLVTITDNMDLSRLATLGRKLQGHAQNFGRGGDIFLADPQHHYLGRTCPWKRCAPGIRVSCDALHCGRPPFLHDDLGAIELPTELVAHPPLELWPKIVARVVIPNDVTEIVLQPLQQSSKK